MSDPLCAYHEAGHALVAHALGMRVVFIEALDGGHGKTKWKGPEEIVDAAAQAPTRAAIAVAGQEAEVLALGVNDARQSGDDLDKLAEAASDASCATRSEIREFEAVARSLARRILSARRADLEKLATGILSRPARGGVVRLRQADVSRLLQGE
jgi:hypothetical protein